jgi:hypothetical protein
MKIYFAGDTMSNPRQQNWFKFLKNRLLSFYLIIEEERGGAERSRLEEL